MTLGEKIKYNRNKLKLSQEQLAEKCGLSRNAIYNYENNKRTPTISILMTIAESLSIPPTELIDSLDDNKHIYKNKISINDAVSQNIKNTLIKEDLQEESYNSTISQFYDKYFFKLFNWKTINMQPKEYFEFILSISPIHDIEYLTAEDISELSLMFSRFLSLKSCERSTLNEHEKIVPGSSKKYEENNFLNNGSK